MYKKILSADFQTPNYVSDEAKDLFSKILNTDPETRLSIEEIRKHPWFNLVPCEANFKGVKVGIDPMPIDETILERMDREYNIDKNYAKKCIQANRHNHATASYYLLLKDLIKNGGKSIADVRSSKYDPLNFLAHVPSFTPGNLKDTLENASMVGDEKQEDSMVSEGEDEEAILLEEDADGDNKEEVEKPKEK